MGKCEPYNPEPDGPRPVATFVRFTPTLNFDHDCIKVDKETNTVSVECSAATGRVLCTKRRSIMVPMSATNQKYMAFSSTQVFSNTSQEQFFANAIEDLVDKALDGYSGTVIACGSVGSGKTYTLFAHREKYQYRGVVARCLERIYTTLAEWDERSAAISMSFIEVVGENITDLLSTNRSSVTIVDNGKRFELKGMSSERVITVESALVALFRGCAQRTTQQHPRCAASSAGHAVLTVRVESRSLVETEPFDRYAELTFVDMAGFEKIRTWELGPGDAAPAVTIDVNKSMSFLEQLIMSMAENRSYIPIRATRLTHILKSKIGNKCDTRLIACVSGEQCHLSETMATLRFAVRLRGVICSPQQKLIDDPNLMLTHLKKELADTQSELYMQDMMARRAPKMHGELSHQERDLIRDQVRLYMDGKLDNIQIVSVKQIEAVLEFIKTTQAERETELRNRITAEQQQETQLQLQQLQQQLTTGAQPAATAADHRVSLPQHGRERGGRRRTSRARVGRDASDDDRTAGGGSSSRREDRQTPVAAAGAATADQSGPGFGVGVADGRPNAAAVAVSARARARLAASGGGGGGGAGTARGGGGGASSERPTSPPASVDDAATAAGGDDADVPLPTDAAPADSQQALRQLLLTAEGAQLQSELDQWQRTIGEQHQQYVVLARQVRDLCCQQSGLQADLQLQQMERHLQGERYDADANLVVSSDERQLTVQLRQLSHQLADNQDRLLTSRRELVDSQRQQTEKQAELTAAATEIKLRSNGAGGGVAAGAGGQPETETKVAQDGDTSASAHVSVQPVPVMPEAPRVYYSAQRRARLQLRRTRRQK